MVLKSSTDSMARSFEAMVRIAKRVPSGDSIAPVICCLWKNRAASDTILALP
jgi:hypothetical protein